MTLEHISALALFALVTSITPGPNNLMLMASGANFGFRKTLPHMLGIGIGFCFMVALVGLGLAQVFERVPFSHLILKILSVLFLLYLAWKIAIAQPAKPGQAVGVPITFLQAAAFQWVNPKAWAMALTATSAYTPEHSAQAVLTVAVVFAAINLPAVSAWTVLGQQVRRVLTNPKRLRLFNLTMALLLVASLVPVLLS